MLILDEGTFKDNVLSTIEPVIKPDNDKVFMRLSLGEILRRLFASTDTSTSVLFDEYAPTIIVDDGDK